jgi:hypothetical protein
VGPADRIALAAVHREAIVGDLAGKTLARLPALIVSYGEFKASYPAGSTVLSRDTGTQRPYGTNPYAGYDDANQSPFLLTVRSIRVSRRWNGS